MTTPNRLHWLDSMRGIAAMLVVCQHFFYDKFFVFDANSIYAASSYEIFRTVNLGKMGVVVFFFISGMIIPQSLLLTRHISPIKSFVISRIFRLYPAYWASVILIFILFPDVTHKEFFLNLTMLQQFFGEKNMLGVYWTLQIELIFYFICGVLFYKNFLRSPDTAKKMFLISLLTAFVMSVMRCFLHRMLPVAMPLSLSVMFLGTYFYWHGVPNSGVTTKKLRHCFLIFIVALIPISLFAYSHDTGFSERWYAYFFSYSIGAGLFVLFSTKLKINTRLTVFLGTISYSLYLFHPLCRVLFFQQDSLLNTVLGFLTAIFIATLSYYFIEKPGRRVGVILRAYSMRSARLEEAKCRV